MSSDAHLRPVHPHPLHHGNRSPPPANAPPKPSSSLVDHVAAKNWKEVWKELAPYHTYVVSSDPEEARLMAFRHLLIKPQHLRSCGTLTSVWDLILHDNSDKVPILILEAILAMGVDVESKASIWLKPDYNAAKRAMFLACMKARPDKSVTRPLVGRSYVNDEDLAHIMRQHFRDGSWASLADLVKDGKWYAFRNRMRRGVVEEDEFRRKFGSTGGKTCQQLLLEKADKGIQVELAYRYPHLFRELFHVHHHHHQYEPAPHHHHFSQQSSRHHEPMHFGSSVRPTIPRFDITLPEKEQQPTTVTLTSSSATAGGGRANSSSRSSRIRRINSDVSSTASGDEYDFMDVENELSEMKRWLMDVEKKVEGDRTHYAAKEKVLASKIADVASQMSGLTRTFRCKELSEEEEKEKNRARIDEAVAAEVQAATRASVVALEKAVTDLAARLEARMNVMDEKLGKLEKAVFGNGNKTSEENNNAE